jgi:putative ABC transport system ATP-binding protein
MGLATAGRIGVEVAVPAVRAEGVGKRFSAAGDDVQAVSGLSLSLRPGELCAVTGPSGSGKSTLLALLAGLERPDSGEVWIEGEPLSALSDSALSRLRRRRVGFIFQEFNLVPHLTLEQNAALPLLLDGLPRAQREERAREALHEVGLGHRLRHLPDQVSGGERQRAAIARALAVRPALLLADEPTGSLDSQRGAEVLGLLRRACDGGCAVLLVTHDPAGAAAADRVLRLRDGRLLGGA